MLLYGKYLYNGNMEKPPYKLTIYLSEYQREILESYKQRTGQNYSEAFRCWLMNTPEGKAAEAKQSRGQEGR